MSMTVITARLFHVQEIYRSSTLLVRKIAGVDTSRWVITFDRLRNETGFDRAGFAEDFLKAQGISAIHVLGCGNDWYQYPDMAKAVAAIGAATQGAVRRITYGSSMGGYAAIRLADAVGAAAALALSPQYSNDPARVPWEDRWQAHGRRIAWLPWLEGPIGGAATAIIAYDPHDADGHHAALIAAETVCVPIPIAHCGHPAGMFLAEVHLLRPLLEAVLADTFDPSTLIRDIRARRRLSANYLGTLAARQPTIRQQTAIAITRLALSQNPGLSLSKLVLAELLTRAGQHAEALKLHAEMVDECNRAPPHLIPYADALMASGAVGDAILIAREVVQKLPDEAHLRHWLASMLWRDRACSDAIAAQRRAVALDPGVALYADALRRYRRRAPGRRLGGGIAAGRALIGRITSRRRGG